MKSILARLLMSRQLDEKRPAPQWVRNDLSAQEFAADASNLEKSLRGAIPTAAVPDDLHHQIMQAVRCEQRNAASNPSEFLAVGLRLWKPALLLLALSLFAWGTFSNWTGPDAEPRAVVHNVAAMNSFAATGNALEMGDQLPANVSLTLLSPLEVERQKLSADLERVAEHLLACIP